MRSFLFIFLLSFPLFGEEIEFNRDIRPILSSKCFACHGTDATHAAGHLRLDSLEAAIKGGDSEKSAIIPGNVTESELVKRILSEDPDDVMPPPDFHANLSEEEIDLLQRWISAGAKYQVHWAYLKPEKAELPSVGASGSENLIDRFLEARLEKEEKTLSPQAKKEVLIRRLFLDLTGLPPSHEELKHYLAVENVTEVLTTDLLKSPHYGERMALDWMDAARYADTHGNSLDGARVMWLWRDWVIKAFNENMPYDQFIKEQIAGDLLPSPSEEQLIATGYNRLHTLIQEGGTIPEENLDKYVTDRVKTVGESILGVTMACAQCHDHKYDPISQREYYEFYAFFNTLGDFGTDGGPGRNARPMIEARSPLRDENELAVLKKEFEGVKAEYLRPLPAEQAKWEAEIRAEAETLGQGFQTAPMTLLSAISPTTGNPVIEEANAVYRPTGAIKPMTLGFKLPSELEEVSGFRLTFLPGKPIDPEEQKDPKKKVHRGLGITNISASFSASPSQTLDLNNMVKFSKVSASSTENWGAHAPENAVNETKDWYATRGPDKEDVVTFTFKSPVKVAETPYLAVETQIRWDRVRKFKVEVISGNDPSSKYQPEVQRFALIPEAQRTEAQRALLKDAFERLASEKALARYAYHNLQARMKFHDSKHSTMVMNTAEKPRKTHILNRGVYSDKLDEVTASTPAVFPPVSSAEGGEPTRLDLANWFIHPDHPLTARVVVNRVWSLFFGKGLSEALADFGSQGTYPSHPELLDWLAVDFQENGWDVKRLVRQIVSSQAYQQSSNATGEQLKEDPKNALLARGPRFRVQAEFIRDIFLKSSGLLRTYIGGESVNPYQPGDLWREVSHYGSIPNPGQTFVQDHGTKLYRRSLYTFWKRTLPPPNMMAFDAPNREVCSIGREATNTPLQALILLNDPQFVEAARALAETLVNEGGTDVERLSYAFQHITSHEATEEQLKILQNQLTDERSYFNGNPDLALGVLTAGEKPLSVHHETFAELASWTNVMSLIFNLSQTITRQ